MIGNSFSFIKENCFKKKNNLSIILKIKCICIY